MKMRMVMLMIQTQEHVDQQTANSSTHQALELSVSKPAPPGYINLESGRNRVSCPQATFVVNGSLTAPRFGVVASDSK